MSSYKVLEIKKNVFEDNDHQADLLRKDLQKNNTFLLNLMSSPGSGKTNTIVKTIEALKSELNIGVLEADIDSDVDAYTVSKTDTKVIQLNTGGMCHLNADITKQGLSEMGTDDIDFVILENVGNLVCPAEFDTGASKNAMILSVPEGDDKPLKYPTMFANVDILLINKIDTIELFDFDLNAVHEQVKKINPDIIILPISAKTGEGLNEWFDWIRSEVNDWL